MRLIALLALGALCGCTGQPAPPVEVEDPQAEPAVTGLRIRSEPPRRNVTMEADPPPPFTYWAPDGATIRNHRNPGLWVALVDGRQVAMYFGDACGASGLQHWIGTRADQLPPALEGRQRRVFGLNDAVTQDLRPERLNVRFDDVGIIQSVECG